MCQQAGILDAFAPRRSANILHEPNGNKLAILGIVAIVRLASKFQDEHDKTRKEQRAFSRHDPQAAAESGAWAGACANHAHDVRTLANEIEAEGAKP